MERTIWLDPVMNEIVFEGRNKMYGAFLLRTLYEKNMLKGMISGFVIFLLAINIPFLIQWLKKDVELGTEVIVCPIVELQKYKPQELTKTIIASKPKSPTPLKPQIKFVPPVVLPDDAEFIDEVPPEIDKLNGSSIGTTTNEQDNGVTDPGLYEDNTFDQSTSNINPDPDVFESYVVHQQPEFPGGMKALYDFLKKELKYPALAREIRLSGTVVIQFIVSEDGQIINASILKGIGGGLDQEALRVVNLMPAWKPGKFNGKAVAVNFKLPIKFQLL